MMEHKLETYWIRSDGPIGPNVEMQIAAGHRSPGPEWRMCVLTHLPLPHGNIEVGPTELAIQSLLEVGRPASGSDSVSAPAQILSRAMVEITILRQLAHQYREMFIQSTGVVADEVPDIEKLLMGARMQEVGAWVHEPVASVGEDGQNVIAADELHLGCMSELGDVMRKYTYLDKKMHTPFPVTELVSIMFDMALDYGRAVYGEEWAHNGIPRLLDELLARGPTIQREDDGQN